MSTPLALSLALLSCGASGALAHASLVEANPAPGAVVTGDSVAIELRFDSRLDPRFSKLALRAATGDEAELTPQPGASPSILKATGTGLGAGRYRLRWRILSVDGHANQGEISFRVEP